MVLGKARAGNVVYSVVAFMSVVELRVSGSLRAVLEAEAVLVSDDETVGCGSARVIADEASPKVATDT